MMLFFELLQVAVGTKTALNRVPSEKEWETLYQICKEQTVQGVAYAALTRLPMEQRPQKDLLMRWYAVSEQLKQRNMKMNANCVAVSSDFQKDGWKHVILKGQGVGLLYPEPLLRVSGDIDIWMEGSRRDIVNYMRKKTHVDDIYFHHLGVNLKDGTEIEAHFFPSEMYSFVSHYRLQQYYAEVASREFGNGVPFGDQGFRVPFSTLAFNRVYILLHIYRHFFSLGIGIRQVMDYYYVLHQGFTEEERQETMRILKRLHVKKFTGAVMYVLKEIFALEDEYLLIDPNVREGKLLLSEIMKAGNFGKYDNRVEVGQMSMWRKSLRMLKHNAKYLFHYPEEVLGAPFFKIYVHLYLLTHRC